MVAKENSNNINHLRLYSFGPFGSLLNIVLIRSRNVWLDDGSVSIPLSLMSSSKRCMGVVILFLKMQLVHLKSFEESTRRRTPSAVLLQLGRIFDKILDAWFIERR